jgi:glycosyltransferase involved in cell wall biosynthesis
MRIAIVSDFQQSLLSGVVDALDALLPALAARGHEVRYYVPASPEASSVAALPGCTVRAFPSFGFPGMPDYRIVWPGGMRADMKAFHPDIVHVQTVGILGFCALRAGRKAGATFVGTNHVTRPEQYMGHFGLGSFVKKPVYAYFTWYYRHCRAVTVPSASVITDYGWKERDDWKLIPLSNPIDTRLFRPLPDRPAMKRKLGLGEHVVLNFGRIGPEKKISETLKAFRLVLDAQPDAQLLVVGEGGGKEDLMTEAKTLGIDGRTRFTGAIRGEPLVEVINASDVYVITSPGESQSLTTLQAMACGIPVVGVNAGAVPGVVGEAGIIIEPGDVKGLADAVMRLLLDPSQRAALGRKGVERLVPLSPASIAEQLEGMYQQALARKP